MGSPLTFGKFVGQQHSETVKGRRFLAAIGELNGNTFTGTVQLKLRHQDEGVWRTASDATGTAISLTTNEQVVAFEFLTDVEARLECTSYTLGPIKYCLGAQVVSNLG